MVNRSTICGLALGAALLPSLALAASAERYGNARFGYWLTIPAGFVCGEESDNGDGKSCRSKDGTARLAVWGGYTDTVAGDGFEGEVAFEMASDKKDGLKITYQATTPTWASYSGTKNGRIVYVRMISGCRDTQYAAFQLEYPPNKVAAMNPVIDKLVPSLQQRTCSN